MSDDEERGGRTVIPLNRDVALAPPPAAPSTKRIRIFPERPATRPAAADEREASAFLTIGPGETRVTVLDEEGGIRDSWVAIFGWCDICEIGVRVGESKVTFEEPELIRRAMSGSMKLYGQVVDTSAFIAETTDLLQRAIEEILSRTLGSGAIYDRIVLSAPSWMRDVLAASTQLRPHIFTETDDDEN